MVNAFEDDTAAQWSMSPWQTLKLKVDEIARNNNPMLGSELT